MTSHVTLPYEIYIFNFLTMLGHVQLNASGCRFISWSGQFFLLLKTFFYIQKS